MKQSITLNLPDVEVQAVDRIAAAQDKSRTEVLREAARLLVLVRDRKVRLVRQDGLEIHVL